MHSGKLPGRPPPAAPAAASPPDGWFLLVFMWLLTASMHFYTVYCFLMPRRSIHTTIMELGPPNHNGDGLLGPNSMIVVYMDPLGWL